MRYVLGAIVLGALLPAAAPAQVIRSTDFTVPPAWSLLGTGTNNNDFGYRTTANAGGAAGEAGGRFTRTTSTRYYADRNLGTPLPLSTPITASGRLDISDGNSADLGPGLVIGHFNPATAASIGIYFNAQLETPYGLYMDAIVRLGPSAIIQTRITNSPMAFVDRTWNYTWDPVGGIYGAGRLTTTVSGPDGGTVVIDVTAAQAAVAPVFDSFGMYAAAVSSVNQPTWLVETYIDDVSYTAAVPEPSSIVLATMGVLVPGARWLRRRRKA
ncbi:MAG: hypothetical protein K1X57_21380 [Gemmataceae bacterium]|nr:hypothetical protein [Gemmataceae bacterium]